MRQLQLGMTDMRLHHEYEPGGPMSPLEVHRGIAAHMTFIPPIDEDGLLCSFRHIFSGSYAAGYYSYKWAEVLSADLFEAFVEAGLDNQEALEKLGRRLRDTLLALGGSRHPMNVFRDFRGREPDVGALLRHAGLDNFTAETAGSKENRV
jgi:oligopeptidase A